MLAGSPAIGAGIALSNETTDERGLLRDNLVDIGAFQTNVLAVNTTLDGLSSPSGDLDLRQAVRLAAALGGAESITFSTSGTPITLDPGPARGTNDTSGMLSITGPTAGMTINGGETSGVFLIASGASATLTSLTISGGSTSGNGGGVYNDGTATIVDCTITGNSAAKGGGVYSKGTVTIEDCTITTNSATNGGGVAIGAGTGTILASTIASNTGGSGGGLLVASVATTSIDDTIVASNTTADISGTVSGYNNFIGTGADSLRGTNGNQVEVTSPGLGTLGNYGGRTQTIPLESSSKAIGAGIGSVSGVTIPSTDQRGVPRGSSVDIGAFQSSLVVESTSGMVVTTAAGLTLPGAFELANENLIGSIKFDSDGQGTPFSTQQAITLNSGALTLNPAFHETMSIIGPTAGVIVEGNFGSGDMVVGANAIATISGLTISGGSATYGGGVLVYGNATFEYCTISGNSAGEGAGLDVEANGMVTLTGCTISGNTATNSGGGLQVNGTATLTNSTLAYNSSGGFGGAIGNSGALHPRRMHCQRQL